MTNVQIERVSWVIAYEELFNTVLEASEYSDNQWSLESIKCAERINKAQKKLVDASVSVAQREYGVESIGFVSRYRAWESVQYITQKLKDAVKDCCELDKDEDAEVDEGDMYDNNNCLNGKITMAKISRKISGIVTSHLTQMAAPVVAITACENGEDEDEDEVHDEVHDFKSTNSVFSFSHKSDKNGFLSVPSFTSFNALAVSDDEQSDSDPSDEEEGDYKSSHTAHIPFSPHSSKWGWGAVQKFQPESKKLTTASTAAWSDHASKRKSGNAFLEMAQNLNNQEQSPQISFFEFELNNRL